MRQIKVSIDFEEFHKKIDSLSYEERNQLEKKFFDFMVKFLNEQEKDYCRKKGLNHKEIRKNYEKYSKMRKAIDNRKKVKEMGNILISFNPIARRFIKF